MLHVIVLLFSVQLFAVSEQMRSCMSGVFDRAGFDLGQQRRLQVGQGMSAYDQRIRAFVHTATPARYNKHTRARTPEEARQLSASGDAQYMPGLIRERVERRALRTDTPGVYREERGTMYKYVEFDTPVGYDSGQITRFMRVELGANGEFHGHPMNEARIRRVCPECLRAGR
jgi:hypothetical protein